jgi:hypothetical protein
MVHIFTAEKNEGKQAKKRKVFPRKVVGEITGEIVKFFSGDQKK